LTLQQTLLLAFYLLLIIERTGSEFRVEAVGGKVRKWVSEMGFLLAQCILKPANKQQYSAVIARIYKHYILVCNVSTQWAHF
jgi:hypothetical protein